MGLGRMVRGGSTSGIRTITASRCARSREARAALPFTITDPAATSRAAAVLERCSWSATKRSSRSVTGALTEKAISGTRGPERSAGRCRLGRGTARVLAPERQGERDGTTAHRDIRHVERSEEHTSELQSQSNLVCRRLLEKKKTSR